MADTYFALKQGQELATELMRKVQECSDWYQATGRLQLWQDEYAVGYGRDRDGRGWTTRRVFRDANNAAITKVKLNHWASILRNMVNIVCAQPPSLQADAENTKSATEVEAQRVNKLLQHYLKREWPKLRKKWVRQALRYGVSWFYLGWSYRLGPKLQNPRAEDVPRDPVTGKPTGIPLEGDVVMRVLTPDSVYYDFTREDSNHDWLICRYLENRYDLAARTTDEAVRRAILSVQPSADTNKMRLSTLSTASRLESSRDLIPVYEFRHKSTDAVPNGKRVRFLDGGTLLPTADEFPQVPEMDNPYPDLFAFRLAPEDIDDSPDGHTPMADLLGPQEAMDAAASHALSKMAASMPVLLVHRSAAIGKKDIETPFSVIEHNAGPGQEPQMMVPSVSPADDVQAISVFQKHMETLSGVNSVVRGNPEEAIKGGSGAAYSLIQAQAILAQTDTQQQEIETTAHIGSAVIQLHKRFNRGFSQVEGLEPFTGEDFKQLSKVRAQPISALQQSVAGRQQLLEALQKMGVQILPDKMIEFLTTGNWETAVEDKFNEQVLIKSENEALAAGQQVRALASQHHVKHLRGHCAELSTTDMIESENAMPVRMAHILEHLQLWRESDPGLLMAMGCPPYPMLMPPPGAEPGANGGPPPGKGANPPGGGSPNGGMPHMPKLPNGQPSSQNSPVPPGVAP